MSERGIRDRPRFTPPQLAVIITLAVVLGLCVACTAVLVDRYTAGLTDGVPLILAAMGTLTVFMFAAVTFLLLSGRTRWAADLPRIRADQVAIMAEMRDMQAMVVDHTHRAVQILRGEVARLGDRVDRLAARTDHLVDRTDDLTDTIKAAMKTAEWNGYATALEDNDPAAGRVNGSVLSFPHLNGRN